MEEEKTPINKIPVIRTYEHDIEEMMAQKKISSASISIAEADARRKETATIKNDTPSADTPAHIPSVPLPPQPTFAQGNQKIIPPFETSTTAIVVPSRLEESHSRSRSGNGVIKSILKIIVSLILIALGIWGGYYLYTISPLGKQSATTTETPITTGNTTSGNITPVIPSIVTPDTQKIIDISGDNAQVILSSLSTLQKKNANSGIAGIVLEETYVSSTTPTTMQVTAPEFIAKIGMNPPDALTTSLNTTWMLGFDDTTPFMILMTNFFQNTFAGMLAWEPTMSEDVSSLFGFAINTNGKYEDRILDNKNIREFVNASGTPLFLYGFIDNQTLIITGNEPTFSDIVNRIEKQTYVR
jgi:hypothetical protein